MSAPLFGDDREQVVVASLLPDAVFNRVNRCFPRMTADLP